MNITYIQVTSFDNWSNSVIFSLDGELNDVLIVIGQVVANSVPTGSGKIEEDDFMKVMSEYLTAEKEEVFDVRDLFDVFDSDKDGFISAKELQVYIAD